MDGQFGLINNSCYSKQRQEHAEDEGSSLSGFVRAYSEQYSLCAFVMFVQREYLQHARVCVIETGSC